jgi:MoaA/NifB/PqqE/SkfB family radical SAM enzyme
MYGQEKYRSSNAKATRMPWDTIVKIICNLRDLNYEGRISWFRINEPLLDNRIYKILALTKKSMPNCHQTITTNGKLLNQTTYDRLIRSGLDHLSISIYDDDTLRNVSLLNINSNIKLKDRRLWYKWENRGGNIIQLRNQKNDGNCQRPSTGLNVMINGKVVLCCADFYADVVMGNVNQQNLEDIWYGKKFKEYRDQLIISRVGLRLCDGCNHDGRGHEVYGRNLALSRPPRNTTDQVSQILIGQEAT